MTRGKGHYTHTITGTAKFNSKRDMIEFCMNLNRISEKYNFIYQKMQISKGKYYYYVEWFERRSNAR